MTPESRNQLCFLRYSRDVYFLCERVELGVPEPDPWKHADTKLGARMVSLV